MPKLCASCRIISANTRYKRTIWPSHPTLSLHFLNLLRWLCYFIPDGLLVPGKNSIQATGILILTDTFKRKNTSAFVPKSLEGIFFPVIISKTLFSQATHSPLSTSWLYILIKKVLFWDRARS